MLVTFFGPGPRWPHEAETPSLAKAARTRIRSTIPDSEIFQIPAFFAGRFTSIGIPSRVPLAMVVALSAAG
jgi:hypothetical protein